MTGLKTQATLERSPAEDEHVPVRQVAEHARLGFVHLTGLVFCTGDAVQGSSGQCTDVGPSDVVFVLPAGYRPAADEMFPSVSLNETGAIAARVDVQDDGKVVAVDANPNTWITLSGISFRATH